MNLNRNTFCVLLSVALSGCVSPPPLIMKPNQQRETSLTMTYVPRIGEEHTVATGDNLYAENKFSSVQVYSVEVQDDAHAKMDLGNDLLIAAGKQGELRKTSRGQKAVCWDFVTTSATTGRNHACLVDGMNSGLFDSAMFATRDKLFSLDKAVPYKIIKLPIELVALNSDFKREILYQGISKGTVKLSFREFVNDMARPAFTQDILYDLEADGTAMVVFKGLNIRIIKATGASMKYIVMRPFAG